MAPGSVRPHREKDAITRENILVNTFELCLPTNIKTNKHKSLTPFTHDVEFFERKWFEHKCDPIWKCSYRRKSRETVDKALITAKQENLVS